MKVGVKNLISSITPFRGLMILACFGFLTLLFFSQCDTSVTKTFTSHDYSSHSCRYENVSDVAGLPELSLVAALPGTQKELLVSTVVFLLLFYEKRAGDDRKPPPFIVYRKRFLFWLWSKSRPFISQKSFLPYFAATRDA